MAKRTLIGPRLAGIVGAAIALGVGYLQPDLLNGARDRVFDQFQRLSPREETKWPVRVVEIDDAALERYGQWPWPRHRLATIVERLGEAGAAAVVFDVILAEPDRTSPANVTASWIDDPALATVVADLAAAPLTEVDHDRRLAGALAATPSVLHLTARATAAGGACPGPLAASTVSGMSADELARVALSFRQVVPALALFREAASGEGFARVGLADDAVVRSAPLIALACGGKQVYPSLAMEALRVGAPRIAPKFAPPEFVEAAQSGPCKHHVTGVAGVSVSEVHLCGLHLPTTEDGKLWIHYSPPDSVAKRGLSVVSVFEDDIAALSDEVRGRIVMIGASAEGLKDILITPMGDERPGVHIHAEIIEQVLAGDTLYRAWDWMGAAEIGVAIVAALVLVLMLPSISAAAGTVLWMLLVGGAFGGAFYAFQTERILINPVAPSLVVTLSYLAAFVVLFQQEQHARRFIRGVFGRFLSPLVVERLEKDPSLLHLEGESREITAFFSDIRGFTTISEQLTPQQVTMLLNQYFTPMTRIVTANKGLVDKYIGDGLAAMWNAPLDVEDHPAYACTAALAMVKAVADLNAKWRADKNSPFPEIRIGMGLHTGEARVGNFGSEEHLQYSMLGDMVNLASRLESLTKEYRVPIIISSATYARAPEFAAVHLGSATVKGRTDATEIFALVGDQAVARSKSFEQFRENFAAAVAAYEEGRRDDALRLFAACRQGETFGLSETIDLFEEAARSVR